MKRKTIAEIKANIEECVLPHARDVAKRASIFDTKKHQVYTPNKRPRLHSEWAQWYEMLTCQITALTPVATYSDHATPPSFPSMPDILFSIVSFVLPRRTTSFKEFLQQLHSAMAIRCVSKIFHAQVPYFTLVKNSMRMFVPVLVPAHYAVARDANCLASFFTAWVLLKKRYWEYLKLRPKSDIRPRQHGFKIWGITPIDCYGAGLVYHDFMYNPTVHKMAWAAMCCHPPLEEDGEQLREMYLNGGYMPVTVKAAKTRLERIALAEIARLEKLAERKKMLQRAAAGLKATTGWGLCRLKRSGTFNRHAADTATWCTAHIKQMIANDFVTYLVTNAFNKKEDIVNTFAQYFTALRYKLGQLTDEEQASLASLAPAATMSSKTDFIRWSITYLGLVGPDYTFAGDTSVNLWKKQPTFATLELEYVTCQNEHLARLELMYGVCRRRNIRYERIVYVATSNSITWQLENPVIVPCNSTL
jgi:hypothetical protein